MSSSAGPFSSRVPVAADRTVPAQSPAAPASTTPAASAASSAAPAQSAAATQRSFTEEGSRSLLTEIRRAILQDTKGMGRRMTVDEALERYSFYGVEAEEVIATMADQGLLVKREKAPPPPSRREWLPSSRHSPPMALASSTRARLSRISMPQCTASSAR